MRWAVPSQGTGFDRSGERYSVLLSFDAQEFMVTRCVAAADVPRHLISYRTLQLCVSRSLTSYSIGLHAPLSDTDADKFLLRGASELGSPLSSRLDRHFPASARSYLPRHRPKGDTSVPSRGRGTAGPSWTASYGLEKGLWRAKRMYQCRVEQRDAAFKHLVTLILAGMCYRCTRQ